MNDALRARLQARRARTHTAADAALIRTGQYTPAADAHLFTDVVTSLLLGKNALLKGPTGAGKTVLAEAISQELQQPLQSVNCSVDLDAEALLGFKTIVQRDEGSAIEFVEGPVVQAMKRGHLLYIDEINMAKPETLPILHGALDYRRTLTNPFTGERIQAHPDFAAIAAINEGYIGTSPLNEALKDRFLVFSVPYVTGDPLRALLADRLPSAPAPFVERFAQFAEELMSQAEHGLLAEEAASIRSLLDAADLAAYMPPLRAIAHALADRLDDAGERDLVLELASSRFAEAVPYGQL